jgi:xylulose-5-phosphate/fructose-6-phosphate phosphoketolase
MTVVNKLDRFHLVIDVINRVNLQTEKALQLKNLMEMKLSQHVLYINENGVDMPEIVEWKWSF